LKEGQKKQKQEPSWIADYARVEGWPIAGPEAGQPGQRRLQAHKKLLRVEILDGRHVLSNVGDIDVALLMTTKQNPQRKAFKERRVVASISPSNNLKSLSPERRRWRGGGASDVRGTALAGS
jgi:hypothetical protein